MDYLEQIERLRKETYWSGSSGIGSRDIHPKICDEAADSIAVLLDRAEEAESRCKGLCKMVESYQNDLIPKYREQARKAEKKLAEAIKDMSGICYLCANSKPFKTGCTTMRSCDHLKRLAANKNPGCEHFMWRGQEG